MSQHHDTPHASDPAGKLTLDNLARFIGEAPTHGATPDESAEAFLDHVSEDHSLNEVLEWARREIADAPEGEEPAVLHAIARVASRKVSPGLPPVPGHIDRAAWLFDTGSETDIRLADQLPAARRLAIGTYLDDVRNEARSNGQSVADALHDVAFRALLQLVEARP